MVAVAGCHCWYGGALLLGAMLGCPSWVPWWGALARTWWSGIAGCHSVVPLLDGALLLAVVVLLLVAILSLR